MISTMMSLIVAVYQRQTMCRGIWQLGEGTFQLPLLDQVDHEICSGKAVRVALADLAK